MCAQLNESFFGIEEKVTLTKNGAWLSNGEEIDHTRTSLAFAKNLHRTSDGFEVRLANEKKPVQVEDTPYFVVGLSGNPDLGFELSLNDERKVPLDGSTLTYQKDRLTCRIPDAHSMKPEEAKFLSQAYYQLLQYIEESKEGYSIKIKGYTIVLSRS